MLQIIVILSSQIGTAVNEASGMFIDVHGNGKVS